MVLFHCVLSWIYIKFLLNYLINSLIFFRFSSPPLGKSCITLTAAWPTMQLSHGAPCLADGPLYDVSSLRQAWSLGVRDCSCFEARVTTRVTSERLRETPVVACCRARGINIPPDITKESPATAACLGAVPLYGISMEFGNQTNFIMLLFIKYSVDHNEIGHTSLYETYHGVCKISMWSFIHILNQTISNFEYYTDCDDIPSTTARPYFPMVQSWKLGQTRASWPAISRAINSPFHGRYRFAYDYHTPTGVALGGAWNSL